MAGKEGGSVVAAVIGNFLVAIAKLVAFAFSGSGAMLAEGIHSVADTMNQALLWLGIRRAQRPADLKHPYGYGAERYFYALMSAMGIFVLGCGVTVYHGVEQLLHPKLPVFDTLTWVVLAFALILEGFVLALALREAMRQRKRNNQSWSMFFKHGDPTLIAVLFEDTIAVLGIIIAAGAIALCYWTKNPIFDGMASIIIGLMLGGLAIVLAMKNKSFLIGQAAAPDVESKIRHLAESDSAVSKVLHLKTRVLNANAYSVDMQVDFDSAEVVERLRPEILPQLSSIKSEDDLMRFAQSFGDRLIDEMALEVDRLEAKIREAVPQARLIDVEGD